MKLHSTKLHFITCLTVLFVLAYLNPRLCNRAVADEDPSSAKTEGSSESRLPETVTFNAHIRPIMSNTCFTCHGPDEESNESGMRLDSFVSATQAAIVPGDPKASLVYQRLMDADHPMPPADFRHQLSDYEKALFTKWIEQGAEYEKHWSFTSLQRPELTTTQSSRQLAIDHFVTARLAEVGLALSPTADKATLLRRLSLDLIGLPPTPAELETFMADDSRDAYEHQVERLLASPQYGERMAALWLDLVRFADTVGYHGDQNQRIFAYRDYVIDSLNENKPFDQFTLEQLAGDLLNNPSDSQLIATGLIRLNMMTREGGAQPNEYRAKYTADRVRMLGTAWLGATTGCCECHHHKYDPFTIKDFYSLGAFFDDVRQWGVYSSYGYTPNKDLDGFTNDHPFPPEIRVRSPSLDSEIAILEREADLAIAKQIDMSGPLDEATLKWATQISQWLSSHPNGWMPAKPTAVQSKQNTPYELIDAQVLMTQPPQKADVVTWTYQATEQTSIRSIELKVLPDEANQGFVGRSSDGRFSVQLNAAMRTKLSAETPVKLAFAQADRQDPRKYTGGDAPLFLDDVWQSGPCRWQLPLDEAKLTHTAIFHFEETLVLQPGDELNLLLKSDDIGKFQISFSPLTRFIAGQPIASQRLANALAVLKHGDEPTEAQRVAIVAAFHRFQQPTSKQNSRSLELRDEILKCRSGYAISTISQPLPEDQIPVARILPRGNWQDGSGEVVTPAFPEFLTGGNSGSGEIDRRLTRKDLAQWLTSDDNPLVARHYVNRIWKHFFGAGLSNKLDDLGNQGEWPSHPQLLDWLAAEFRENWDMKHIARLIVTSDTYKQVAEKATSSATQNLSLIDPHNRLLSQQSARRLEAEIIRDNALAVSGLLNLEFVGGRSVMPFQPEGYYGNLQFPDRDYQVDTSFRRYRRGVYMHWQRTFLHPMLVNFDAPSRDQCTADRIESNSPQQALTLLNDPTFVEAAGAFADRLIDEVPTNDFDARVQRAFQLTLSRTASEDELDGLRQLHATQLEHFLLVPEDARQYQTNGLPLEDRLHPDSPEALASQAALSQVCRVILNLHETITRY